MTDKTLLAQVSDDLQLLINALHGGLISLQDIPDLPYTMRIELIMRSAKVRKLKLAVDEADEDESNRLSPDEIAERHTYIDNQIGRDIMALNRKRAETT